MSTAHPLARFSRVIRIDGGDFRALTVTHGGPNSIVATDRELGGECAAPADCFLAVPPDWPNPPTLYVSEVRAVEASYSGPIPPGALAAAEARDAALPALAAKLDAAEAWLAWVRNHLHPLSPPLFEPHLRAAQSARTITHSSAALSMWPGFISYLKKVQR